MNPWISPGGKMRYFMLGVLLPAFAGAAAIPLAAQVPADSAAIRAAALNYADGWYNADADRMTRALHPELAKRIVESRPGGGNLLGAMTAAELIRATGSRRAGPVGRRDVRILDVFGNTASVRLDMDGWIDYMHLARWNGEWKIVNVLWEHRRP